METQHNIIVQNRRDVKFEFSIRRKITVIQGDSATGKSTLCDMVSNASIPGFTGITISCDVPVKILRHSEYKYVLENTGGNSNLSKYGSSDTLLIGDGSAIGAYIRDMQITGSAMYLPESFEWKRSIANPN